MLPTIEPAVEAEQAWGEHVKEVAEAALEPLVPADSQAVYQASIKPWVAPFDYVVGAGKSDGQQLESRFAVVVK